MNSDSIVASITCGTGSEMQGCLWSACGRLNKARQKDLLNVNLFRYYREEILKKIRNYEWSGL
jgi:hypothetical protein